MFFLAQCVKCRYTTIGPCIPALRGLEFVQKCCQLMGIFRAVVGKDSGLQLSPFWLFLQWRLVAEVLPGLSEAEVSVWCWRRQQKGCRKTPQLAGHQDLGTSSTTSQGAQIRRKRTMSKFRWLTKVGQGGEANACQSLRSTKRQIQNKHIITNLQRVQETWEDQDSWCLSYVVPCKGSWAGHLETSVLVPADGLAAWTCLGAREYASMREIIFTLK